jgi:hypothetical protein
MKKVETSQNRAILLSEETLVDFIEALYRIFKVGIYYPIGHVILDQSASNCVKQLRELSPSLKCVKIKIEHNSFLIEEIKLPESSVSVKELHLLLEKLGIRSLEIERSISNQQLLYFVKNLLTWRMQLESAQSFINFNVADLPDCIRLEQLEFLVDETSILPENSDNDYRQNLDDLCIALGKQGLNEQQVEQCRGLLEKLSEPPEGGKNEIKGFPNATWHDVQTLLYEVVTGSYSLDEQRFDSVANSDINVIASIFENLELSLSDKKSKETIKFMVSHLVGRKTDQSETVKKSAHPKNKLCQLLNDDQKLSVSELNAFIYENNVPLKILKHINSVDSSEEMSIILQLISSDQDEQLIENLEQELKTILVGRLTDRGKNVLIGGIMHSADSGDVAYLRHLLALVLHTLRDSENLSSLDFVVDLWNKMPSASAMHLLLWPFVVNELLIVGMGENREKFFEATEIASRLHADRMKNLCSQLEEMDAFQEKRVAENIFDPNYNASYQLFAFLCTTSLGDIIAEKILLGLRDEPQDPLFEAVGPLLEIMTPSHLEFVHSYLTQAHLEEPPLALKMAAGQIILEYLQNISKEKKELPWLKKTIAATTGLSVKGMEVMLYKIVNDKKMGVLPTWPRNCRIAADAALKAFKRRSLAELL